MYADRTVRQGIAHPVLVAIVDPRYNEDIRIRKVDVLSYKSYFSFSTHTKTTSVEHTGISKQLPFRFGVERRSKGLRSSIKAVRWLDRVTRLFFL